MFFKQLIILLLFSCSRLGESADMWYTSPQQWSHLESGNSGKFKITRGVTIEADDSYLVGYMLSKSGQDTRFFFNFTPDPAAGSGDKFVCMWVALLPAKKQQNSSYRYILFRANTKWKGSSTFEISIDMNGNVLVTMVAEGLTVEYTSTKAQPVVNSTVNYVCCKLLLDQLGDNKAGNFFTINNKPVPMRYSTKNQGDPVDNLGDLGVGCIFGFCLMQRIYMLLYADIGKGIPCCEPPGCKDSKCENDGSCAPYFRLTTTKLPYTCVCKGLWGGEFCKDNLNPCNKKPCENGGTCTAISEHEFTCKCPKDYKGKNCQVPKSEEELLDRSKMADLVLVPKKQYAHPFRNISLLLITYEIGNKPEIRWELVNRKNESDIIKSAGAIPLPVKTKDASVLKPFSKVPEKFLYTDSGFYYSIIVVRIEKQVDYLMKVTGFTDGKQVRRVELTIRVVGVLSKLGVYAENKMYLLKGKENLIYILYPSQLPMIVKANFTFPLEDDRTESKSLHFQSVAPSDVDLRTKISAGMTIGLPDGYFYYAKEPITVKAREFLYLKVVILDKDGKEIDEDSLILPAIEKIEYVKLLTRSTTIFEGRNFDILIILSENLGTDPTIEFRGPGTKPSLMKLPETRDCSSCIIEVIGEERYKSMTARGEIPKKFRTLKNNYSSGGPGTSQFKVIVRNKGFDMVEAALSMTIVAKMKDIYLMSKKAIIPVNEKLYTVLHVPEPGSGASFKFSSSLIQEPVELSNKRHFTKSQTNELQQYVDSNSLKRFKENDLYYVMDSTYPSSGIHTIRAFGYSEGELEKTAKLDVTVILLMKGLKLYISQALVMVKAKLDVVITALELGQAPTVVLKSTHMQQVSVYEANFTFTKELSDITRYIGLSRNEGNELSRNGYFYYHTSFVYQALGPVEIALDASNEKIPGDKKSVTAHVVDSVCSPTINVTNTGKDKDSILRYPRRTSITLGIEAVMTCDHRKFRSRTWKLHVADFNKPKPYFIKSETVQLPESVDTSGPTLLIPPYTLRFWPYAVTLEVTVLQAGTVDLTSRGHGYLEIISVPVEAAISGARMLVHNPSDPLTFDGSQSKNLNSRESKYVWICTSRPPRDLCRGLSGPLPYTTSKFTLQANKLIKDTDYEFTLILSDAESGRTDNATQVVKCRAAPSISIKCVDNCRGELNAELNLVLRMECIGCYKVELTWNLIRRSKGNRKKRVERTYQKIDDNSFSSPARKFSDAFGMIQTNRTFRNITFKTKTKTKRSHAEVFWAKCWNPIPGDRAAFRLTPGCVKENEKYTVSLRVTNPEYNVNESASYDFIVNAAPVVGKCSATPPSGIAMKTLFSFECRDFYDEREESPLSYQFFYDNGYSTESDVKSSLGRVQPGILLKKKYEPNANGLVLSSGDPAKNYTGVITVIVTDSYGQSSQVNFTIVVEEAKEVNKLDLEKAVLTEDKGSISDTIKVIGDNEGALGMINTAAQVIASNESKTMNSYEQAEIRQGLVDQLTKVESNTFSLSKGIVEATEMITRADPEKIAVETINATLDLVDKTIKDLPKLKNESSDLSRAEVYGLATSAIGTASSALKVVADEPYFTYVPETSVTVKPVTVTVKPITVKPVTVTVKPVTVTVEPVTVQTITEEPVTVKTVTAEPVTVKTVTAEPVTVKTVTAEPVTVETVTVEGISEEVKKKYQTAQKSVQTLMKAADVILKDRTTFEEDVTIKANGMNMYLKKAASDEKTNTSNTTIGTIGVDAVVLPPVSTLSEKNATEPQDISIKIINTLVNPYGSAKNSVFVNTHTVSVEVEAEEQKVEGEVEKEVKPKPPEIITDIPVEYYTERRGEAPGTKCTVSTKGFPLSVGPGGTCAHIVRIENSSASTFVLIQRSNLNISLLMTVTNEIATVEDFMNTTYIVPPENSSSYFVEIDKSDWKYRAGEIVISLVPYTTGLAERLQRSDSEMPFNRTAEPEELDYNLTAFRVQCLFLNQSEDAWTGVRCQVGPNTSPNALHCKCEHLSTFGGSFLVMPNFVDPSRTPVLFTFVRWNVIASLFMLAWWTIYLILLLYSLLRDRRNKLRRHTIVLEDDMPDENYPYVIKVFTGIRCRAGTSGIVSIELHGRKISSRERTLCTSKRRVFRRGSEEWFLLKTQKPLGNLRAISLSLNNIGNKPKWYVSQVKVIDPTRGRFWLFMVNSWFSSNPRKGLHNRYIPAVHKTDIRKFSTAFRRRAMNELRNRHLWFSIFHCSHRSSFTRAQRLSSAFATFAVTMLLNAMMFEIIPDEEEDEKPEQFIDVLEYRINYVALIIGLIGAGMAFPVGLVLSHCFSLVKARDKSKDEGKELLEGGRWEIRSESLGSLPSSDLTGEIRSMDRNEIYSEEEEEEEYGKPETVFSKNVFERDVIVQGDYTKHFALPSLPRAEVSFIPPAGDSQTNILFSKDIDYQGDPLYPPPMKTMLGHTMGSTGDRLELPEYKEVDLDAKPQPKKRFRLSLPWFFVYPSWLLCISTGVASTYFIVMFASRFGFEKSIWWFASNLIAFLGSTLLLYPLHVLIVIIFMSCCLDPMRMEDVLDA